MFYVLIKLKNYANQGLKYFFNFLIIKLTVGHSYQ